MSMSYEQSSGDDAPEVKAPANPEVTPDPPADERAPEDLDPTTEATPKKGLAVGRAAASVVSAGQSLGDVGGVACAVSAACVPT